MLLKTLVRKAVTVFNNPKSIPIKFLYKLSPFFSDVLYLKLLFPLHLSYKLDLNNPKTYNEKLQWLKIHYRRPVMSTMADKYEAKEFAKGIIGANYIVNTLGVWDSFEKIDFDRLPNNFVLKTTHDQGGVVVVNDKSLFDKAAAKKKLEKHLRAKHFYLTREWPYKNVKPRIMAEELLENTEVGDLWDYKFYCFHGEPKIMYIAHGRHNGNCFFDFFDMSFQKLNIERRGYPQSNVSMPKPDNWELMKSLSAQLSHGLPHVRVDFYESGSSVYLGELTFFQGGGMMPFYPAEWDFKLGNFIDLEKIKKEILLESCKNLHGRSVQ